MSFTVKGSTASFFADFCFRRNREFGQLSLSRAMTPQALRRPVRKRAFSGKLRPELSECFDDSRPP